MKYAKTFLKRANNDNEDEEEDLFRLPSEEKKSDLAQNEDSNETIELIDDEELEAENADQERVELPMDVRFIEKQKFFFILFH